MGTMVLLSGDPCVARHSWGMRGGPLVQQPTGLQKGPQPWSWVLDMPLAFGLQHTSRWSPKHLDFTRMSLQSVRSTLCSIQYYNRTLRWGKLLTVTDQVTVILVSCGRRQISGLVRVGSAPNKTSQNAETQDGRESIQGRAGLAVHKDPLCTMRDWVSHERLWTRTM